MPTMQLKPLKYLGYLDYEGFYRKHIDSLESKKFPRFVGFCPFHNDKNTPNLNINAINGRFICWSCGAHGSYLDFIMRLFPNNWEEHNTLTEITDKETLKEIKEHRVKSIENIELERALDKRLSENAYQLLLQQPLAIKSIYEKRGYTLETINKYGLGWLYGALTFPIYDAYGNFISLKVHKQYQTEGATNQLYPWSAFSEGFDYVIIHEGEPDTLLVRQMGFNAVTQILGCNSWDSEFNKFFKGKTVYVGYDNDTPGKNATKLVTRELLNVVSEVYQIVWPSFMAFSETHGEDSTDFFIKHKRTAEQYSELLAKAKPITKADLL
jgi:DNA primase